MAYTKPMIVAQNATAGSYAAGCPAKDRCSDSLAECCTACERTA